MPMIAITFKIIQYSNIGRHLLFWSYEKLKVRALFAFVLCFMLTSTTISTIILSTSAQSTTPLPSAAVTLKAFDSPKAYFIIQLSNVPSGCGITNGNYSGWCIDRSKLMERAPATHQVLLY